MLTFVVNKRVILGLLLGAVLALTSLGSAQQAAAAGETPTLELKINSAKLSKKGSKNYVKVSGSCTTTYTEQFYVQVYFGTAKKEHMYDWGNGTAKAHKATLCKSGSFSAKLNIGSYKKGYVEASFTNDDGPFGSTYSELKKVK